MNIRERILSALSWQEPDRIPFTIYEPMLPRGADARRLRELGLGLIVRLPGHRVEHRQVRVTTETVWREGEPILRRTLHTPVGEVWKEMRVGPVHGSTWIDAYYIKEPDDYRVMEYVYRDAVYRDNYATLRRAKVEMGDDGLVLVRVAKGPMQEIVYQLAGMERVAFDLHDCRDRVESLYHTMCARYRDLYDLAAGAPVEICQLGDNIDSAMVSPSYFRRYCVPVYETLMNRLEGTDKRLMVHMDGSLRPLVPAIAEAPMDIVEAFTPPPVGDVPLAEARRTWPDKALWINFTSSMHLAPTQEIEAHTEQLIAEAGGKAGFGISITEDVPPAHLARSLTAIARVINAAR